MNPRWPIYVVSKGRWTTPYTSRFLAEIEVPHFLVVEPQEVDAYANAVGRERVIALDLSYKDRYDCFDSLGTSKSTGPGPARNFVWDHATASGAKWHWVMDDNIRYFCRMNRNRKIRIGDGTGFRVMEDFCARYANVAMAGPNYRFFAAQKEARPVYVLNTRIYSCNLIRNDTPFRWRGRYNEDTDLSLRMLKAKWCTVQFNAFLQEKMRTQSLKGGNTAEFYAKEGTRAKSEMQVAMHPDVSRVVTKYGRIHHHVDYSGFRHGLIRRDANASTGIDNYGMEIEVVS